MPIYKSKDSESLPGNTFQFSPVKLENLDVGEYTLINLVDVSKGVFPFSGSKLQEVKDLINKIKAKENIYSNTTN